MKDHRVYDALDIAYNFILYLIAEEYYRTTGWIIFYDVFEE